MKSAEAPENKDKAQLPDDIEDIFQRFDEMAVGDIKRAFDGGAKVGAFILTFVAIDCLATWYGGRDSNAKVFGDFVTEFFSKQYKAFAKEFHFLLRSGLVHNYTIKQGKYALTDGDSRLHLEDVDGSTVLNWQDFFRDFLAARDCYYEAVRQSRELQHRLRNQIERQGLLEVHQVLINWLKHARVGTLSSFRK